MLTLVPHSPNELNRCLLRVSKIVNEIDSDPKREACTTATSNEDYLCEICKVGHIAIRSVNRRLERLSRIFQCVGM